MYLPDLQGQLVVSALHCYPHPEITNLKVLPALARKNSSPEILTLWGKQLLVPGRVSRDGTGISGEVSSLGERNLLLACRAWCL